MYSRNLKIRMQRLFAVVIALVICAESVQAQFTINFDENGNGTIQTTAGFQPLPSLGNIVDPFDPNNGLMPLAYNLAAVIPGVVPFNGDIDVIEPPTATGMHSDLLRWTQGLLLVYSDTAESGETPDLADVGLPLARQMPLLTLPETGPESGPNGLFGYTPNLGDPGYYPVPPGPVTYNFTSDAGAVPEPASCLLLLCGSLGLILARTAGVRGQYDSKSIGGPAGGTPCRLRETLRPSKFVSAWSHA